MDHAEYATQDERGSSRPWGRVMVGMRMSPVPSSLAKPHHEEKNRAAHYSRIMSAWTFGVRPRMQ
jgi:hypothetical protein